MPLPLTDLVVTGISPELVMAVPKLMLLSDLSFLPPGPPPSTVDPTGTEPTLNGLACGCAGRSCATESRRPPPFLRSFFGPFETGAAMSSELLERARLSGIGGGRRASDGDPDGVVLAVDPVVAGAEGKYDGVFESSARGECCCELCLLRLCNDRGDCDCGRDGGPTPESCTGGDAVEGSWIGDRAGEVVLYCEYRGDPGSFGVVGVAGWSEMSEGDVGAGRIGTGAGRGESRPAPSLELRRRLPLSRTPSPYRAGNGPVVSERDGDAAISE